MGIFLNTYQLMIRFPGLKTLVDKHVMKNVTNELRNIHTYEGDKIQ